MKINPAYVVLALVSTLGALFTAPLVAQYFWESILTGVIGIQSPAYWTMFALVIGVRWMLLSGVLRGITDLKDLVKTDESAQYKTKAINQTIFFPWVYMGFIVLITYLCK